MGTRGKRLVLTFEVRQKIPCKPETLKYHELSRKHPIFLSKRLDDSCDGLKFSLKLSNQTLQEIFFKRFFKNEYLTFEYNSTLRLTYTSDKGVCRSHPKLKYVRYRETLRTLQ